MNKIKQYITRIAIKIILKRIHELEEYVLLTEGKNSSPRFWRDLEDVKHFLKGNI